MKLTETTTLLSADIPVTEFSDYMRLGSGFADDGSQNVLLETVLRAAMGAIEARIGKVLIAQGFNWQIYVWRRDRAAQVLPVSPVNAISQIVMIDDLGVSTPVDAAKYRLEFDNTRPRLVPKATHLPEIPVNGSAVISLMLDMAFGWMCQTTCAKRCLCWRRIITKTAMILAMLAGKCHLVLLPCWSHTVTYDWVRHDCAKFKPQTGAGGGGSKR